MGIIHLIRITKKCLNIINTIINFVHKYIYFIFIFIHFYDRIYNILGYLLLNYNNKIFNYNMVK